MPDPQLFVENCGAARYSYWGRAPHCAELPVMFGLAEKAYASFNLWWMGPYREHFAEPKITPVIPKQVMARTAYTWYCFAKTGDPNNQTITKWNQYDTQKTNCMFFDLECDERTIEDIVPNYEILSQIKPNNDPVKSKKVVSMSVNGDVIFGDE